MYNMGLPNLEATCKVMPRDIRERDDLLTAPQLSLFKLILDILSEYIHDFAFHSRRYAGCKSCVAA